MALVPFPNKSPQAVPDDDLDPDRVLLTTIWMPMTMAAERCRFSITSTSCAAGSSTRRFRSSSGS
jgi:hypothetical protein